MNQSSSSIEENRNQIFNSIQQWNFFHIPKCGGTSLAKSLSQAAKLHNVTICNGQAKAETMCEREKKSSQFVFGHQYYGLVQTSIQKGISSKYVTMLRHPVTRVYSLYNYIRNSKFHHHFQAVVNMTIPEFLEFEEEATNEMTRMLCGPRFGDISEKCSTDKTYAIEKAKDHLLADFAVIGLQECYADSLSMIRNTIPWAHDMVPYYKNRLSTTASLLQLSMEDGEAILQHNAWDMEIYYYAISLFHSKML